MGRYLLRKLETYETTKIHFFKKVHLLPVVTVAMQVVRRNLNTQTHTHTHTLPIPNWVGRMLRRIKFKKQTT